MRKIKLVKLNKEFNNGKYNKAIGTPLEYQQFYDLYKLHFCGQDACYFTEEDINKNTAGLFAIEYEPEEFKFTTYGTRGFGGFGGVYDFDKLVNSELNRLADWCDGQSEKDLPREYFVEHDDISLLTDWTHDQYFRHGLKFNSKQSAKLFILELNKPENSDYKKYFIELLKKTRL